MTKNTFSSAKSATLEALEAAAALDAQIRADIAAACSPKHTAALRELANQRLRAHGKVAAAVRYLDQCANRPSADPVRAAILRGDVEVYGPVLMSECFEQVDLEDADPEGQMLLADVWPAWLKSHGVTEEIDVPDLADLDKDTGAKQWLRVRPQWLYLVSDTLTRVAEWLASDLVAEQAMAAMLRRLAKEQLGGAAGLVVEGRATWDYKPAELEQSLQITATLARNAAARAKEARAAKKVA